MLFKNTLPGWLDGSPFVINDGHRAIVEITQRIEVDGQGHFKDPKIVSHWSSKLRASGSVIGFNSEDAARYLDNLEMVKDRAIASKRSKAKRVKLLSTVVEFLLSIGLPMRPQRGLIGHFLPGIKFREGQLLYCPEAALSSDLLHEAGHLAVVPAQFRHLFSDDVERSIERMFNQCKHLHPDHPLLVKAMQASECEATAWSWAAGVHLGLAPHAIIRNNSFSGEGATIRLALGLGQHYGVHGLARAGFCDLRKTSPESIAYPHMRRWLQD